MSKHMRQSDRVLQYLLWHGSMTRLDAAREIGCFELASRIGELEARGVKITRRREKSKNRFGDTVQYVRYALTTTGTGYPAAFPPEVGEDLASRVRADRRERLEHQRFPSQRFPRGKRE